MSKAAYFDCFSGISGDMILGAFIDAGLEPERLNAELHKMDLGDWELSARKVMKQHLSATQVEISSSAAQRYRHLKDLNAAVDNADLAVPVRELARSAFLKIATAEAQVHQQPLEKVHFHEVGALDTIIDVVGAMVAVNLLGIQRIYSSPINVGSGFVSFSHGTFPVPAPATVELLKGVPIYSTDSQAELATPTGAAIITTLAGRFGDMPALKVAKIGYGAGQKDLPQPNVLRIFIGEERSSSLAGEEVAVLETTIDDMNPQFYEAVMEELFGAGALDVYLTPLIMKKSRPAVRLTVLARPADQQQLMELILRQTTSLGIRIRREERLALQREIVQVDTPLGPVPFKIARWNGEIINAAPEYEACKRIAAQRKMPLKKVFQMVLACAPTEPAGQR